MMIFIKVRTQIYHGRGTYKYTCTRIKNIFFNKCLSFMNAAANQDDESDDSDDADYHPVEDWKKVYMYL